MQQGEAKVRECSSSMTHDQYDTDVECDHYHLYFVFRDVADNSTFTIEDGTFKAAFVTDAGRLKFRFDTVNWVVHSNTIMNEPLLGWRELHCTMEANGSCTWEQPGRDINFPTTFSPVVVHMRIVKAVQ